MTEEIATKIVEAVEGVDNSLRLIAALIVAFGLVFFAFYIFFNERSR